MLANLQSRLLKLWALSHSQAVEVIDEFSACGDGVLVCLARLTSERVLVNMDTKVHPDLINNRFAYVSVSRASRDAQVFTDDAAALAKGLSHDVSKASAIQLKTEQSVTVASCETKRAALGLGL